MQIPQTISSSTDPNAPAFFKLPAEIRNTIYEFIVTTHDELEICPVSRHGLFAFVDSSVRAQQADMLCLLTTCRQAYYEVNTLLLTSNTWVISRPSHDSLPYEVTQGDVLANWLTMLGPSVTTLRKVLVNLGQTGHNRAPESPWWDRDGGHQDQESVDVEAVKLGRLLKALWANPDVMSEIEFVNPNNDHE
jgi:hypothetical protein